MTALAEQRPRLGPRPLSLHLMAALAAWTTSIAALPLLRSGSVGWRNEEAVRRLRADLEAVPENALTEALIKEILDRLGRFAEGILRYRTHPYHRRLPDPPTLWSEGPTRLLDYGNGAGKPLLVVPSLVNRAYVLDLTAERSFLRWLAAERGFRPLLVDWGAPGAAEREFDLTDYVAGRLVRALEAAKTVADGPMPAIGYCMGGTLLVALAQRRPSDLAGVVLLATPWDFHTENVDAIKRQMATMRPLLDVVEQWGEMPVDALQALFTGIDPLLAANKFRRFANLEGTTPAADAFVALEDWLNDGIALTAPVAVECLAGWYGGNTPASGTWKVAGELVDPSGYPGPSLHVIPAQDRIVPPASALALARAMPDACVHQPPLGHIGMMVGGRAVAEVWRPIADWMAGLK